MPPYLPPFQSLEPNAVEYSASCPIQNSACGKSIDPTFRARTSQHETKCANQRRGSQFETVFSLQSTERDVDRVKSGSEWTANESVNAISKYQG